MSDRRSRLIGAAMVAVAAVAFSGKAVKVIVRKSASADLLEGGVAGAVDIITRKPLQFRKQFTVEASVGAVYADLPKETDPQFNALFNWKNDAGTMGVLVQGFSEQRHLRRDGQETLGYSTISPT